MRRLILLTVLVTAIFVTGCENTEDNSPALQGQIDDFFYKAADARAVLNEDGTLIIQGATLNEALTLNLRSTQLLEYPVGGGQQNSATFEDSAGNVYTTVPNGTGSITLTDRCLACGWLTGVFNFTAIQEGVDTITVNKGFFFKVSFLDGQLPGETPTSSDGAMTAEVDGNTYDAVTVNTDIEGNTLKIEGFQGDTTIVISLPVTVLPGNYEYPADGFSASIITDGVEDPAASGLISVNFNNVDTRVMRVFFSFVTEGGVVVTMGNTIVDY